MNYSYPYLQDSTFLRKFDEEHLKEQFVKITILTLTEKPLQDIQGRAISGSINIDGSSSIRRTCTLSMVADEYENDLTNIDNIISLNKKVEIQIGFINNTSDYTDYSMIWYPVGIYVITDASISFGSSGVTISLQLKDKMCLLNGECGGTLPAAVTFSEYDTIDENGQYVTLYPTIYQIIQELVNHWGGEQLGKIIISDVDLRIKKVMKWVGNSPLYIYSYTSDDPTVEQKTLSYMPTTNFSEIPDEYQNSTITYSYGDDIGYINTDFIYSGDLVGDAGSSVCDILDQIKNYLGNYEYFYDINGNFIFQEIKNYLNTSYSTVVLENLTKDDYLIDLSKGKAVYVFDDANMMTAYTNNPQYSMIKNDFVVWGERKNADGMSVECRYHLSIDKKPSIDTTYKVFLYTDSSDNLTKAKCPIMYPSKTNFPIPGTEEFFYMDTSADTIWKWDSSAYDYVLLDVFLEDYKPADWRTALYLQGSCAEPFGKDSNYYYTELANEWPKLCDLAYVNEDGTRGKLYDEVINHPWDIDFYLDFIDSGSSISEFNISNIGRRSKVIVDNDVNCVFEPDIPDLIWIENNQEETERLRQECIEKGQNYIQCSSNIYSAMTGGGSHNSAYVMVRELLYQYTSYNENINLTALPIYYLEPNTRITVRNNRVGIFGDYIINKITIPLNAGSTMTLDCTRALERI